MRLEPAQLSDLAPTTTVLVAAQLPVAGVHDQFPEAYAVARDAGSLVGVAGLQRYGRFGLLRSVAVAEAHRGSGIGRALVTERLAAGRAVGLEGVYLLTATAAQWFFRLGFERVARPIGPAELLATPEFVDACPASADCLLVRFSRGEVSLP